MITVNNERSKGKLSYNYLTDVKFLDQRTHLIESVKKFIFLFGKD